MKNKEHYGKTRLIKIGDYNISEENDIITIPLYMTFAIEKNQSRRFLILFEDKHKARKRSFS